MTTALEHRGPDHCGYFVDPMAGIGIGHRRLSIIDLSDTGSQPMSSQSGQYVVAFNGEIYNHNALRRRIRHPLRGTSDTEVLVELIDAVGIEQTLEFIDGMFAIAIWNTTSRELTLVRDRFGEKPMYYGWCGQDFVFASELPAIRQHPRFDAEINRTAVRSFFNFNCVPAPLSIYERFKKIAPGEIVTVSQEDAANRSVRTSSFHSVSDVAAASDQFSGSYDDAVSELNRLITESVRLRMVADVPVGCFLSGGVDSSLIAATMQSQISTPISTFCVGFEEVDYDEAIFAKRVAQHLGTQHHELVLSPSTALELIPRLSSVWDEPFADPSQLPMYLVSELAKTSVKVCLSGDAGDELFAGYRWYEAFRKNWSRVAWMPNRMRRAFGSIVRQFNSAITKSPRLDAAAELLTSQTRETYFCNHYQSRPNPVLDGQCVARACDELSNFSDYVRFMTVADLVTFLPDDILTKVDRATMHFSLEARVPLLSRDIVEWSLALPASMQTHQSTTKRILRDVLYRYVPRDLIERPKQGFSVPIHQWIRGPLRDWAEDLLADSMLRQQGWLDAGQVRRLWSEHLAGQNHEIVLWRVLMFQSWLAGLKRTASCPSY